MGRVVNSFIVASLRVKKLSNSIIRMVTNIVHEAGVVLLNAVIAHALDICCMNHIL